jgi:outer membrane protein
MGRLEGRFECSSVVRFPILCLLAVGALFLPWVLHPAGVAAADLLSVYNRALENDPRFQAQEFRHEASPEALNQAYADLLPTLEAEASYQRREQQIISSDVAVFGSGEARYPTRGYTLTLTQPLWRYDAIVGVMQAKHEVRGADLAFEAAKQDLMLRVAEAYMGALEARDNLTFTRAEEEAVQAHFDLARGRYRNGLAPITDYHDARARLANVQARKAEAQNRMEDALEALRELTGERVEDLETLKEEPMEGDDYRAAITRRPESSAAPGENAERPSGSSSPLDALLAPPDPDDAGAWIDAAGEQNPTLEAKRQEVEVARREISRQNAGHMPRLELVGRLNRNDEGGSLFGGESDVQTWEGMVQLKIPIFNGFGVVSKVREARTLHKAAKKDLEREERALRRETKAAFLGVKAAIQSARALRQSVLSHRVAVEAKRRGFRSGLFPSLAVLDAERDLHLARQDHARAQYDYLLNSLRLKAAVGTLSEDALAEVNGWLE